MSIILNLRRAPPQMPSDPGFTKETLDRLLDEKRQARIGLALAGGCAIVALCIIGWIVVAMLDATGHPTLPWGCNDPS